MAGRSERAVHRTGVIADLPDNSHLKFDGLLSGLDEDAFPVRAGAIDSEALWNGRRLYLPLVSRRIRPERFLRQVTTLLRPVPEAVWRSGER